MPASSGKKRARPKDLESSANTDAPPAKRVPSQLQVLADLPWSENNDDKTWQLINALEEDENFVVYFGSKNSSDDLAPKAPAIKGDTKATVCKRISAKLFPAEFEAAPAAVVNRVRNKISSLIALFKKHNKRLNVTGGGLRDAEDSADAGDMQTESSIEYLDFYFPATGPDETTPMGAKNLWDAIVKDFPFFARLYRMFGERPNVNPPTLTTGVGPKGHKTIFYQRPSSLPSSSQQPPELCLSQPLPDEIPEPARPTTLLDILNMQPPPGPLPGDFEPLNDEQAAALNARAASASQRISTAQQPQPRPAPNPEGGTQQPIPRASQRPAKTSQSAQAADSRAAQLIADAKKTVKPLKKPATFEDKLLSLQSRTATTLGATKEVDSITSSINSNVEQRKQILAELAAGLRTQASAQEEINRLSSKAKALDREQEKLRKASRAQQEISDTNDSDVDIPKTPKRRGQRSAPSTPTRRRGNHSTSNSEARDVSPETSVAQRRQESSWTIENNQPLPSDDDDL